MSIEKPWEKPFNDLLEKMISVWGGKIQKPSDRDVVGAYVYPKYTMKRDGFVFEILVNEFPLSRTDFIGSEDNVEYLRIYCPIRSAMDCIFRHETIMDRIKQKIGLSSDFVTGNESFDRTYRIQTKPGKDMSWLHVRQNQEIIESLEPFSVLRIIEYGIQWAREISSGSQLAIEEVDGAVTNIQRLAELLDKSRD